MRLLLTCIELCLGKLHIELHFAFGCVDTKLVIGHLRTVQACPCGELGKYLAKRWGAVAEKQAQETHTFITEPASSDLSSWACMVPANSKNDASSNLHFITASASRCLQSELLD